MHRDPINRSTPMSELRERLLAEREQTAPQPRRIGELVRRHRSALQKNAADPEDWKLSDIVVRNDGRIATVQETRGDVTVSRVTTQIFAAVPWDEEALVRRHLPANTRRVDDGWVYTVTSEFGDSFDLFLRYDEIGRQYQVYLVAPNVHDLGAAHRLHIYSDGRLCLSPGYGGQHMLSVAYAESVLWCNGISAIAQGRRWPWGQAGEAS